MSGSSQLKKRTIPSSPESDRENNPKNSSQNSACSSPAKIPRIQKLNQRHVLGEIPRPSRTSGPSSQANSTTRRSKNSQRSQSKSKRKESVSNNDAVSKQKKMSSILKKAIRHPQEKVAEEELADQVEDINGAAAGGTSGIIKNIKLYNFMCHASLNADFHPNLNFITGENGSGKSAILSGILVGLGARATTTARTKAIKSLIKTGKDFAKIEITLLNRGLLDMEKYGSTFTVERIIDSKGTSTYKIRTSGKSRIMRKCELDYILMALGIQLDNPVAILNQETARSFLRSKDPKDKYKLFYEGTLLRSCDDLLQESVKNIETSSENFENSREIISAQTTEIERLNNLMRKIVDADAMKKKIGVLEIESLWSRVIACEKTLQNAKKCLNDKSEKLKKIDARHERLIRDRQVFMDQVAPNSTCMESMVKDLQIQESLLVDIREDWKRFQKNISENKAKLRSGKIAEEEMRRHVKEVEKQLERARGESQEAAIRKKNELSERKLELETQRLQVLSEMKTLKADGDQFKHGAEACRYELNQLEDEMRQINNLISNKKTELSNLNKKIANKYLPFGREMETLVAKIKANQNSFRKQPFGPLGACFTVKDTKWLPLVEFILHNSLHNFTVDNSEDSTLLNKLISQVYGRNSVGTGNARRPNVFLSEYASGPYDISRGKASTQNHPTILDVLKFEGNDFIVRNALCDTSKIERILLFENKLQALEILKDRRASGFPGTCSAGFTLDFYKITPDPNLRADALNQPRTGPRFLKLDSKDTKVHIENQIRDLEAQCRNLRPKIDVKRQEEAQLRGEFNKREERRSALAAKYQQMGIELESVGKKSANTRVPDVNNFIEELSDRQRDLDEQIRENQEAHAAITEYQGNISTLNAKKVEIEAVVNGITEKMNDFENSKHTIQEKIDKVNLELQKIIHFTRQVQSDVEAAQCDVAGGNTVLKARLEEAEQSSAARVETDRSPNEIKYEIASLKAKIAEVENHLGSKKQLCNELKEAKAKYQAFHTEFEIWYNLFLMVKQTVNAQQAQFQKSITTVTTGLQACFKSLIGTRGYKGTLSVDNKKKELFYFVCPDAEASTRVAKVLSSNNQKTIKNYLGEYGLGLSGGECSFSTICFIISMWQAMQCPFFMLDEFDVFMDAFNRKASQNALMSHAMGKKGKGRQFFLLSPLELTEVPDQAHASVLRISAPNRTSQNTSTGSDNEEEERIEPSPAPTPGPSKRSRRK